MLVRLALILVILSPPVRVLAGLCCTTADAVAQAGGQSGCCASDRDDAASSAVEPEMSCCKSDAAEALASCMGDESWDLKQEASKDAQSGCGIHSSQGPCCDKCPCCVPAPPMVLREMQKTQVRPPSYPLAHLAVEAGQKVCLLTSFVQCVREREHPPDHGTRQAQLVIWLN